MQVLGVTGINSTEQRHGLAGVEWTMEGPVQAMEGWLAVAMRTRRGFGEDKPVEEVEVRSSSSKQRDARAERPPVAGKQMRNVKCGRGDERRRVRLGCVGVLGGMKWGGWNGGEAEGGR